MPELPDVVVYLDRLAARFGDKVLRELVVQSPFVVRTVEPSVKEAAGRRILGFSRIGKRIVFELEGELYIVVHLMIAGRFHLKKAGTKAVGKVGLATFVFDDAALVLTEASTKKRASIHMVRGKAGLKDFDRGGLEPLEASREMFIERLRLENHTLKRTLTDPTLFSGIGNAYSDEILHAARLSPMKLSQKLDDAQATRLYDATRATLLAWIERLQKDTGDKFPEKVTAFRPEMAVHGRYKQPCPVCGTSVARIAYAENECNYCPRCQTEGRMLADRSLSRLLKDDWPRTIDELEQLKARVSR